MDCSNSLQIINNGIAWVDTLTKDVWAYAPGNEPERLSFPNKKAIFDDIKNVIPDLRAIFSSFQKINSEYTIYIPAAGGVTKAWTYNFEYKKWTYNEFYDVTGADNAEIATSLVTIDDLKGSIDSLVGTIDSLSPSTSISVPFSYGHGDGSIAIADETLDKDAAHTVFPAGINFNTELASKVFVLPEDVLCVTKLNIEYRCTRASTISLFFSKDEGKTWTILKTVTASKLNQRVLISMRRQIRTRRFIWKLVWNRGDVEITNFELFGSPSGDSTQGE